MNEPNHRKCVSLRNQKCMTQPTLINLHPNEYKAKQKHLLPFYIANNELKKFCIYNIL